MNYQVNTKDDQAYQRLNVLAKKNIKLFWMTMVGYILVTILITTLTSLNDFWLSLINYLLMIPSIVFMILAIIKASKAERFLIKPEFPYYQSVEKDYKYTIKFHKIVTNFSAIFGLIVLIFAMLISGFEFNPLHLKFDYIMVIGLLSLMLAAITALSMEKSILLRKQYLKYHQVDQEK